MQYILKVRAASGELLVYTFDSMEDALHNFNWYATYFDASSVELTTCN